MTFSKGDKVRSKRFGGAGRAILAYFPTVIEARKVYSIGIYGYNREKPVVIYSSEADGFGGQRVAWDYAESVELVEPEPEKKGYTQLLDLADNLIFVYGITDPDGHTGDVLKQLVAALREETGNADA
jgi:hypothetical protein